MENSERPETDTFARQMAALCTSGPTSETSRCGDHPD